MQLQPNQEQRIDQSKHTRRLIRPDVKQHQSQSKALVRTDSKAIAVKQAYEQLSCNRINFKHTSVWNSKKAQGKIPSIQRVKPSRRRRISSSQECTKESAIVRIKDIDWSKHRYQEEHISLNLSSSIEQDSSVSHYKQQTEYKENNFQQIDHNDGTKSP